jgi:acetoin:2,6-dichlorophenolindophenol oxidoreductase subunit beta
MDLEDTRERIIYEKKGPIARVTLNWPEKANAQDQKLVEEMDAALLDADRGQRILETIRMQGKRGPVPVDPAFSIPLGRADIKRPGTDVTLISYGRSVHDALAAATTLQEQGVSAEVVDLRTLVPLDVETMLESARRTRRVVVVHDAVQFGGPGAEITAILQSELFGELAAPIERVGARFVPAPAEPALEAQVYPSPARIVAAAQRTLRPVNARG